MALDLTAVAVRGRWVKHTYPGSPPLPERDPLPDNRWQRGTTVDALYLADCEETAWAEWYRHLAERAISPLAQMPRELWTWQVDVEVANLSTEKKLAAVELGPPAPGRHGWRVYQLVGEQISSVSRSRRRAGLGCSRRVQRARRARSCVCSETSTACSAPSRVLRRAKFANHLRLQRGW